MTVISMNKPLYILIMSLRFCHQPAARANSAASAMPLRTMRPKRTAIAAPTVSVGAPVLCTRSHESRRTGRLRSKSAHSYTLSSHATNCSTKLTAGSSFQADESTSTVQLR